MTKFIEDIKDNYRKLEHELVTQLNYEVEHGVVTGTNREEIWVDFFRRIVPKKFNIARSVFIIDSNSKCSKEVDIAIYDEQYTPYIFNYGNIKFIPIEAVAAVVQCKSKKWKKRELENWAASIKELKTSQNSIVRLANMVHVGEDTDTAGTQHAVRNGLTQTATTPIKILCYLMEKRELKSYSYGKRKFDIVLGAYVGDDNNNESGYGGNLYIKFHKNKNLYKVLLKYNHAKGGYKYINISRLDKKKLKKRKLANYAVKVGDEEYSLLSFIFQFNQMLMMINNPMFFPHMAYVKMFNKMKEEKTNE